MELDDIVGRIFSTLETLGVADDTLIIFMSDNGAINSHDAITANPGPGRVGDYSWQRFQHYQNSVDIDGVNYKLRGGKASPYEGGLRVPFLWRYPKLFQPRLIKEPVSYLDLYRTLADIIDSPVLPCNEAPDSRSLMPFLRGEAEHVIPNAIIHHCIKCGEHTAIREKDMKLIGGDNELYNITADPEELNNLYNIKKGYAAHLKRRMANIVNRVNAREARSDIGSIRGVC